MAIAKFYCSLFEVREKTKTLIIQKAVLIDDTGQSQLPFHKSSGQYRP
jgi:hypothetical protein